MQWLVPLVVTLCSLNARAEVLEGRVVAVTDGNTLTLLDGSRHQHKIRLAGIDAPELSQPYGSRSRLRLSNLAFGRDARADCDNVDRFGRNVCTVYVHGRDVARAQLEAGLAWCSRKYVNEQLSRDATKYEMAQDRAAADRVGLWKDENPVPPWEWRRERR
jgi:endonuclease YncB( thermonuclease family)